MAVTTTYALSFIKLLDLTQGPTTAAPDATALANGGFAVSGSFAFGSALDIFRTDTSDGGGAAVAIPYSYALDELTSGNIVMVGRDTNSFVFAIRDPVGGHVRLEDLGWDNTSPDVSALTGGGFCIVGGGPPNLTYRDIDVYIRDNVGNEVVTFPIDATIAEDYRPGVAGLDDGNFAVAWTRGIGSETHVMYAIYNSAGGVVRAPGFLQFTGTYNDNVNVTAKLGGFAIAYESNVFGTGTTDVVMARFALDGTYQGMSDVSNPTLTDDGSNDTSASVTRLSNNYLAVSYRENLFADGDTVVKMLDPATGAVLATRYVTAGESASDVVQTPTLTGFAKGGLAVFHLNSTDNDVDGEHLQATRTSTGDGAGNIITGDNLRDVMAGGDGNDILRGMDGDDVLRGGTGNDTLQGLNHNDVLSGQDGLDAIIGGPGRDLMTGGLGADRFDFDSLRDSGLTVAGRDRITDFTHLTDDIDLRTIDAKASIPGNDVFAFRGTLAFSAEGQVRVVQLGLNTIVELNTSGATGAEMSIQLDNVTATALTLADFFM